MGSLPATRGTWSADGLVQDSGSASDITFITGNWGNFVWKTIHGTVLLGSETDDQSSISLKLDSDFTNLNINEDGVWHFEAEGRFVILSGTGNYAGLHGEGSVKTVGTVEFLSLCLSCPYTAIPPRPAEHTGGCHHTRPFRRCSPGRWYHREPGRDLRHPPPAPHPRKAGGAHR